MFGFTGQLLCKTCLILRRIEPDVINVHGPSCQVPCSHWIVMKVEFSQKIFKKFWSFKFHEHLSSGSRVVPCRQSERNDIANGCVSQFCEHVY